MLLQSAAMAAWKTFQTGDRVPSELLNIRNFERANNQRGKRAPRRLVYSHNRSCFCAVCFVITLQPFPFPL